jgi:hypothetical protein
MGWEVGGRAPWGFPKATPQLSQLSAAWQWVWAARRWGLKLCRIGADAVGCLASCRTKKRCLRKRPPAPFLVRLAPRRPQPRANGRPAPCAVCKWRARLGCSGRRPQRRAPGGNAGGGQAATLGRQGGEDGRRGARHAWRAPPRSGARRCAARRLAAGRPCTQASGPGPRQPRQASHKRITFRPGTRPTGRACACPGLRGEVFAPARLAASAQRRSPALNPVSGPRPGAQPFAQGPVPPVGAWRRRARPAGRQAARRRQWEGWGAAARLW